MKCIPAPGARDTFAVFPQKKYEVLDSKTQLVIGCGSGEFNETSMDVLDVHAPDFCISKISGMLRSAACFAASCS